MPVVFIVTERGYQKVISNIQEIKARGGRVIIITTEDERDLKTYSEHIIQVPKVHHCLQSILTTVPLQLLAYYIAYVPLVIKQADLVLCNSEATAREIHRRLNVPTNKLITIKLCFDRNNLSPKMLPRENFFLVLGLHNHHKNLLKLEGYLF